jgi:hypothetical protein
MVKKRNSPVIFWDWLRQSAKKRLAHLGQIGQNSPPVPPKSMLIGVVASAAERVSPTLIGGGGGGNGSKGTSPLSFESRLEFVVCIFFTQRFITQDDRSVPTIYFADCLSQFEKIRSDFGFWAITWANLCRIAPNLAHIYIYIFSMWCKSIIPCLFLFKDWPEDKHTQSSK